MKTKYSKNEDFFAIPNTVNSSLAGIFASDGNIRQRKYNWGISYSINLGISQRDRQMLEEINRRCLSNYIIRNYIYKKNIKKYYYECHMSMLSFYSAQRWEEDLEKNWNLIGGNKTLRIKPPNLDNLDNCLAFISGLITGDGTIYMVKRGQQIPDIRISMLGTYDLLVWCRTKICDFLGQNIRGQVRRERPEVNVFSLCFGGIGAARLIEKINKMDVIKLTRKWEQPEVLNRVNIIKDKPIHKFIKI